MQDMTVLRSIALFLLAALAEIGGAWLVWQGVREHRGLLFAGLGVLALGAYGFVATLHRTRTSGGSSPRTAVSSSRVHSSGACWSTASGRTAGTWPGRRCAWPASR
jgi:hypothetical protein